MDKQNYCIEYDWGMKQGKSRRSPNDEVAESLLVGHHPSCLKQQSMKLNIR